MIAGAGRWLYTSTPLSSFRRIIANHATVQDDLSMTESLLRIRHIRLKDYTIKQNAKHARLSAFFGYLNRGRTCDLGYYAAISCARRGQSHRALPAELPGISTILPQNAKRPDVGRCVCTADVPEDCIITVAPVTTSGGMVGIAPTIAGFAARSATTALRLIIPHIA